MIKYIIEIAEEYEEYFKGVLICGIADGKFAVDVIAREDLEELNSDYINEHFGELQDEAYQRGLEDAWETARALVWDTSISEYDTAGVKVESWDGETCEVLRRYPAHEAVELLRTIREHKDSDRIEVGDEVRFLPNDRKGIVTACHVPDVYAENDKYAVFCGTTVEYVLRQHITKTGKHYDIQSILEAMRK